MGLLHFLVVGERSTWVWIAVITVSHERMVICIHFYIFSADSFTPAPAQTHWFGIFLSFFWEQGFALTFAQQGPDLCTKFK